MARNGDVHGWIKSVIDATIDAESPERFFYWAAVAAISAAVRKNVYMLRGGLYKLYPNLYIMLMARSAMSKGYPVWVAKTLVEKAKMTRVISGRNTIQAVLMSLGKAYSQEDGSVIKNAQGFLVSGEFSSFIQHDPEALTILTDLYDTNAHDEKWENTLKTVPIDRLLSPCITLLGASNEEHFNDAVQKKDITGGFVGRTLIIYEEKKRKLDSLTDEREPVNLDPLATKLAEISKISGRFLLHKDAKDMFDSWYQEFGRAIEGKPDPTGTAGRMQDTILKVAMCLALSDSPELIIHPYIMQQAMESCLGTQAAVKHVASGKGESIMGRQTKMVIDRIDRKFPDYMDRKSLLAAGWGDFDAIDLDRIIETLLQAGAIEARRNGTTMLYKMRVEAHEQLVRFQREIQ